MKFFKLTNTLAASLSLLVLLPALCMAAPSNSNDVNAIKHGGFIEAGVLMGRSTLDLSSAWDKQSKTQSASTLLGGTFSTGWMFSMAESSSFGLGVNGYLLHDSSNHTGTILPMLELYFQQYFTSRTSLMINTGTIFLMSDLGASIAYNLTNHAALVLGYHYMPYAAIFAIANGGGHFNLGTVGIRYTF